MLEGTTLQRLKGRSLFVGTPMYGGQCHVEFAYSIARLSALCGQLGIGLRFHFLCGEALVMRARNEIVETFLRSDGDHLLFIDADIGFEAEDALQMLALQAGDSSDRHDVLAAPYPQKKMAWDIVAQAAKAGVADEDPALLAKVASRIVFHPDSDVPVALARPVQAKVAGTGFMMIRRATFDRFRQAHPGLACAGTAEGPFAYFDTAIDSKAGNIAEELRLFLDGRPDASHDDIRAFLADPGASMKTYGQGFISEDFTFCRRVRDAGMEIWLCPWMQLAHSGSHVFETSLAQLALLAQSEGK
ncbi:MAG: hypothetical protein ACOY5R_00280 [Pseudomonadota bacterium]